METVKYKLNPEWERAKLKPRFAYTVENMKLVRVSGQKLSKRKSKPNPNYITPK
jgi:hypothetical protein